MQLAETAQRDFGKYRVETVMFTNKSKEEMAYNLRTNFEDKSVFIPKRSRYPRGLALNKKNLYQSRQYSF